MRLAVIGDLHTKLGVFHQAKELVKDYDKLIFLGDYVDDWLAKPEDSKQILKELIALKKKYPKKITLLLGNHELSEWLGGRFKCSGYSEQTHRLVKPLLDKHEDLFQLAEAVDGYLFTHAGLTKSWARDISMLDSEVRALTNEESWVNYLNKTFRIRNASEISEKVFSSLSFAGSTRGGSGSPSPIWADKEDFERGDLCPLNQVVGHTPVCHVYAAKKIYFCDTFSESYLYGMTLPIGDGSILTLEDGEPKILERMEWQSII